MGQVLLVLLVGSQDISCQRHGPFLSVPLKWDTLALFVSHERKQLNGVTTTKAMRALVCGQRQDLHGLTPEAQWMWLHLNPLEAFQKPGLSKEPRFSNYTWCFTGVLNTYRQPAHDGCGHRSWLDFNY